MNLQQIKNKYDIIGNAPQFLSAINKAVQVAPTDLSILVTGESGSGKEVFARMVHDNSPRRHKSLVSVNCGAIPEGTIESELFGHLKGSFTGADRDRKGYFEEADKGTIFLDEVGELPLAMQVKLLRVLENGEITPVGASKAIKVDVRIVAATNVDLSEAIRKGRFREDLFYRLNQIAIAIPPLRERRDDIPLLFRKFATDVAEKYGMAPISLTDEARAYLMDYPWYGNVRELKNITEQIAIVETERVITKETLQNYIPYTPQSHLPVLFQQDEHGGAMISDRELLLKALTMGQMINDMRGEINQLKQMVSALAAHSTAHMAPHHGASYPDTLAPADYYGDTAYRPFGEQAAAIGGMPEVVQHRAAPLPDDEEVQEMEVIEDEPVSLVDREKVAIRKALEHHRGRRRPAAAELGISERTLYRKIKEYGIEE